MATKKTNAKKTATKATTKARGEMKIRDINIPRTPMSTASVRIYGPQLVVHNWHNKGLLAISNTEKRAKGVKPLRIPENEYEATKYISTDGTHGIPATAIKNAIATATVLADDVSKAAIRRSIYVHHHSVSNCKRRVQLVDLEFESEGMRDDIVRLAGASRTPEMRWRAEYIDWAIDITIDYNRHVISTEQLLHLVVIAGESIGLCEGRPEKSALAWGRFNLDLDNGVVREVA